MATFETPFSEIHLVYSRSILLWTAIDPYEPIRLVLYRNSFECRVNTRVEYFHRPFCIRRETDACSRLAKTTTTLINDRVDPATQQSDRKCQARDSTANNGNLETMPFRCHRHSYWSRQRRGG